LGASETRNLRAARCEQAVGRGKLQVLGRRYVGVISQRIFDVMAMMDMVEVSVLVKGW